MRLDKFIAKYIDTNSVVRLWSENKGEKVRVENKVRMAHELQKDAYASNVEVVHVTDIIVLGDSHPEAVNIVIRKAFKPSVVGLAKHSY